MINQKKANKLRRSSEYLEEQFFKSTICAIVTAILLAGVIILGVTKISDEPMSTDVIVYEGLVK